MTTGPVTASPDLYTALVQQAAYLRAKQEAKAPPTDPHSLVNASATKPQPPDPFALALTTPTGSGKTYLGNPSRPPNEAVSLAATSRFSVPTGLVAPQSASASPDPSGSQPDGDATTGYGGEAPQPAFLEVQTILVGDDDPARVSRHPFLRFAARLYQNISRYRPSNIEIVGSALNAIA